MENKRYPYFCRDFFSKYASLLVGVMLHDYLFFYRKVLLGVTGSVATIKTEQIINELKSKIDNVEIILVPTHYSEHFLPSQVNAEELLKVEKIYRDEDEWSSWNGRGDPVLHIELRKWADVLVIAPLRSESFTSLMALDLHQNINRVSSFSRGIIIVHFLEGIAPQLRHRYINLNEN